MHIFIHIYTHALLKIVSPMDLVPCVDNNLYGNVLELKLELTNGAALITSSSCENITDNDKHRV
jgi:hypothetical protein